MIDEFQYLFGEKDAVTNQAVQLLEDLARRGRSQGIHLVLASQDVSGIQAFWMRPAIFEQFVLRIGLPRARRVLDREQRRHDAPATLARRGEPRVGGAARQRDPAHPRRDQGGVDAVQDTLHERYAGEPAQGPRLFDGSQRAAGLGPDPMPGGRDRSGTRARSASASTSHGRARDRCAARRARPQHRRHRRGRHDAMRVLAAAAASLDEQHHSTGEAVFVLAPLSPRPTTPADALAHTAVPPRPETVRLDKFAKLAADWPRMSSSGCRAATAPRST